MKYLLRNLEIELDPPTFPSFNDNRIINCYIKCIRDEHNNPAIFITSPPPFMDLYFIIGSAELWFLSSLFDTVSLWHFYPDCPGQKASPESAGGELAWKACWDCCPPGIWAPMREDCLSIQESGHSGVWWHCHQDSGFFILRGQNMQAWSATLLPCWVLHIWVPAPIYLGGN